MRYGFMLIINIKGFIEKNAFSNLKDNLEYYKKNIVLIERDPMESIEILGKSSNKIYSEPRLERIGTDQNLNKIRNRGQNKKSSNLSLNSIISEPNSEESINDNKKTEMNLTDNKLFRMFLLL